MRTLINIFIRTKSYSPCLFLDWILASFHPLLELLVVPFPVEVLNPLARTAGLEELSQLQTLFRLWLATGGTELGRHFV